MKKISSVLFILVFTIILVNIVLANNVQNTYSAYNYKDYFVFNSVSEKRGILSVTGSIPSMKNYKDYTFKNNLNEIILSAYQAKIKDVEKSKYNKSVHFFSTMDKNNNIVSIILNVTITSSTTKNDIITFNYDESKNKILTINDILGVNGINIINTYIKDQIKRNPNKYNSNFNGIDKNQSFYLSEKGVVVIFDQGKMGPVLENNITFELDPEKILDYTIDKDAYFTKENYEIKMIPLRDVCEKFGYDVSWNNATKTIDITKNSFKTYLTLNKNNYKSDDTKFKILESPPILKDSITYVPISFFDEMLGVTYSINNSSITFSNYDDSSLSNNIR